MHLSSDNTEKKIGICENQVGYLAGLNAFKAVDSYFFMFKQPKRHTKIAALMLLLLTEATVEEKVNTCTD